MSFQSFDGSKHRINGSLECLSASSKGLSKSLFGVESTSDQRARVERSLKNRKGGDMIKLERDCFLHYAIYIGKDNVVDFVADNGGIVTVRTLCETVGASECAIDNYLDNDCSHYPEKEIVKRALLAIAEEHIYSLGTYNCEHFATWCRYGYKYCHQPCEVAATLGAIANKT
ncbi:phospholipid-metabolizing enzyme A-C1-like [Mizuhopecten yessoensis]|uniref:phospholipid-metabolizing enzyme A-C1-like n=1 Tax=Mizuhopecten yessoensis TaxID=6573 RepID=UPI000B45A5C4|nr:phospholipid-metabolizing enzyme A-C1-like [Mizuhopecten yessoensis]